MAILELQRMDELADFATGWNQLLSKSLDNHPFLTSEWLSLWWKHFGKGKELKLFTAESSGAVSLVVPVMYSTHKVLGSKRSKAEFVASGDSDYQSFIVTDLNSATRNLKQLIKRIMEDSDVDCIVFGDVPENSITSRLLENVNKEAFGGSHSIINSCPYALLPYSYDTYLQGLGCRMRKNLKRCEKQASKDYKVELLKYDKIGTVEDAMKIFFELHQKRRKAKGDRGLFSDNVNRNFHIDLANAFAEKGWLSLFFLTFNGKPVSTIYSYEYNGKLYYYLGGFDPEYSKYGPGQLIIQDVIKYGIAKQLKEFDFLRGDEAYKKRWKTAIRNNIEFRVPRRGFKSKFYNWNVNNSSSYYLHGVFSLPQRFF